MNFGYIALIIFRTALLGLIVFYSVTAIPSKAICLNNRVVISIIVVTLYALLDYFTGFPYVVHGVMCRTACGCSPYQSPKNITTPISPDIDAELDKAIAQLNSATQETEKTANLYTDKDEGDIIRQKAEAEAQAPNTPKPNDAVTEGFTLF